MKHLSYLFILIDLVTACAYPIELEQEPYDAKVVVDGYIESGGYANIFLTWSSPFLTAYDSVSIQNSFITTASITLSSSTGETEPLTLFRNNRFFPPFVYKSTTMTGKTGETYTITIRYKGKIITATTSIPEPPRVGILSMRTQSDSAGQLNLNVFPWTSEESYLFVQVKSFYANENYHTTLSPVFKLKSNPEEGMHTVPIHRVAESNLHELDTTRTFYSYWPRYLYSLNDIIAVKYGTIDFESYQTMKSIFADQVLQTNPFAINTIGIRSNINGGTGRWMGIGLAPILVYSPLN